MLKVAITGNIASGKSAVEKILIEKGYKVFDTDRISHIKTDELSDKIIETFYGFDIISNNRIDRKKLGRIVFSDNNKLKLLESILHPAIKQEIKNIFEQNKNEKTIFISVPLLFESGFEQIFDNIIFVSSQTNIRLKRLMARNNLTKEEALQRINLQNCENEKIKKSNFVIKNNGNIAELSKEVEKVLSYICP